VAAEAAEHPQQYVFTVTDGGFAKKTVVEEYRLTNRGGLGVKAAKLNDERGGLVGGLVVTDTDEVLAIRASGQVTRSSVAEVRPAGRDTMGLTFARANGDPIVAIARNAEQDVAEVVGDEEPADEAALSSSTPDSDATAHRVGHRRQRRDAGAGMSDSKKNEQRPLAPPRPLTGPASGQQRDSTGEPDPQTTMAIPVVTDTPQPQVRVPQGPQPRTSRPAPDPGSQRPGGSDGETTQTSMPRPPAPSAGQPATAPPAAQPASGSPPQAQRSDGQSAAQPPDAQPAGGQSTGAQSAGAQSAAVAAGPTGSKSPRTRKARLRLTRLDPWSVMKMAFALSIALAIVTVVAVAIVWSVLEAAGVWESINSSVGSVLSRTSPAASTSPTTSAPAGSSG
jgi:hypothetical protein